MSVSRYNNFYLLNILTFNSHATMEELDLAIDEEVALMRTSRTATFTLSSSSSSSSSSSCSNLYNNNQNGRTSKTTTICSLSSKSYISENHPLLHSQSLMLDNQRHRPAIHDPYQLSSNLQLLDNWMIVSVAYKFFFLLLLLLFWSFRVFLIADVFS
ncbi:unnamed protein product [Rotaria socialis]|uniref:Uncharacterized protein n=2 Tax=Rotaria socialis TaxID=392032 RepID=A0A820Z523_9BILA|nr:unnamed protein product [Rotaria socialis]CAF4558596.1 unnamed protein product [Rotaria socialis]